MMFLITFSFWMVLKFLKKENSKEYLTGFILNLCTLAILGFEFVFIKKSKFPCDSEYQSTADNSIMNIINKVFPPKEKNKETEGESETDRLLQKVTPSAPPLPKDNPDVSTSGNQNLQYQKKMKQKQKHPLCLIH